MKKLFFSSLCAAMLAGSTHNVVTANTVSDFGSALFRPVRGFVRDVRQFVFFAKFLWYCRSKIRRANKLLRCKVAGNGAVLLDIVDKSGQDVQKAKTLLLELEQQDLLEELTWLAEKFARSEQELKEIQPGLKFFLPDVYCKVRGYCKQLDQKKRFLHAIISALK